MQLLAMLSLMVGAAIAAETHDHGSTEENCACAQYEADHPFTIDCTNKAAIDTAMLALESETCMTPRSDTFEWGGTFETPADAYTWVSQAATSDDDSTSGKKYADAEMMLVAFVVDEDDVTHLFEKAAAANTKMTTTGACPEVSMTGGTPSITPTADGTCVTIKFPDATTVASADIATTDFKMTVTTTGIAHVAFFTAHMPTEFERDTHYFMSTDLATDIEPKAQNKEYCKISANADGLMYCQQAFFVIQAHHDYCDHDTLTTYQESLFHEWESKCKGCLIRRKYKASQKSCPTIDCSDAFVAELGYSTLNKQCIKADTEYAFEWAGSFATPDASYTWVSQAATANTTSASNYSYADAVMTFAAYVVDGDEKSKLFALKEVADTLMGGSCPIKTYTAGGTMPEITPLVATYGADGVATGGGACVTIQFPDSNVADIATSDFKMKINTASSYMALFTAHLPTEFERNMHYLMPDPIAATTTAACVSEPKDETVCHANDVEAAQELGAAASHDHGRRLAVATKGKRALENTHSIGRKSHRRLANAGSCCRNASEIGSWELVVAYHDLCDHSEVPPYIEVGFHDYEASCEDYFCNLVGPDVDQLVCPFAPPSPPPSPTLPPAPLAPVVYEKDDKLETGAIVGIVIAAVIALMAIIFVIMLISKEKSGTPMFAKIEDMRAPPASSTTSKSPPA